MQLILSVANKPYCECVSGLYLTHTLETSAINCHALSSMLVGEKLLIVENC